MPIELPTAITSVGSHVRSKYQNRARWPMCSFGDNVCTERPRKNLVSELPEYRRCDSSRATKHLHAVKNFTRARLPYTHVVHALATAHYCVTASDRRASCRGRR